MASRTIYSCDWCGIDAPRVGSRGAEHGWRHHGEDLLCAQCIQAIETAINEVKRLRSQNKRKDPEGS